MLLSIGDLTGLLNMSCPWASHPPGLRCWKGPWRSSLLPQTLPPNLYLASGLCLVSVSEWWPVWGPFLSPSTSLKNSFRPAISFYSNYEMLAESVYAQGIVDMGRLIWLPSLTQVRTDWKKGSIAMIPAFSLHLPFPLSSALSLSPSLPSSFLPFPPSLLSLPPSSLLSSLFWVKVLLCGSGWPQTSSNPTAPAFQILWL